MKKWILISSISIYGLSLWLTPFYLEGDKQGTIGIQPLIVGVIYTLTLLQGGLAWLANPLIFIVWFNYSKRPKLSLVLSVLATICALSFLSVESLIINEAGHTKKVIGYGVGYWLWLSSCLILVIGNLNAFRKKLADKLY